MATSCTSGAWAAKNHVVNLRGASGGGVQCEMATRPSGSSSMPASSRASRTAARRAARPAPAGTPGAPGLVVRRVGIDVLGIDLATGEHPHAAEGVLGVAMHHQHLD